ncbi:hypothetical protein CEXT_15241 [Caerostris extrusa]|uniref:Uncharacterized protein n=1 Tax=Caerostris extrusa TaxID=172846 RepID=A0AAV4WYN1_CAEEX|nr:hypothetical protein CEXT_15241 [Caerostris extrusa]
MKRKLWNPYYIQATHKPNTTRKSNQIFTQTTFKAVPNYFVPNIHIHINHTFHMRYSRLNNSFPTQPKPNPRTRALSNTAVKPAMANRCNHGQ